jgi:hypothetical protein
MILRGFLLGLAACLCFLPDCTGQVAPSLNGSWLLTGGWDPALKDGPRLTLTMGSAGEDLFGEGDYQVPGCAGTFVVHGKLAADGTFTLTSRFISITGTFADGRFSSWTGSYKASFGNNCSNSSGKFIANRIKSPQGTYSGTMKTPGGKTVTVSLRLITGVFTSKALQQNVEADMSIPTNVVHFTPVIGTLNIAGLGDMSNTEFTAIEDPNSRVFGDEFIISFPLENKSILKVAGIMKDGEASAALVMVTIFSEGKPTESAAGVLVRQ